MANNSSSSSNGIGFFGLLTIVFITLKLIGIIQWSWWLVLSPILVLTGFVFVILAICAVIHYHTIKKAKNLVEEMNARYGKRKNK